MPFNVDDKVRFTERCDRAWFFGPHRQYKTGVIESIGGYYNRTYKVRVDGHPQAGSVDDEHIELLEEQPAVRPVPQSTTFYTLIYKTRHTTKRTMGFLTEQEFNEKKRTVLQQGGTVFGEKKLKLSNV